MFRPAARLIGMLMILLPAPALFAQEPIDQYSGRQLMEEVYERHRQFPYVYEEQSMVLIDRNGNRETRRLRRYSRVEEDGTVKFLLLFVSPREVSGVALLANRDPSGKMHKSVYLPAYGNTLIESKGVGSDDHFLGTDFSVENLTGESLTDYVYVRERNERINGTAYFIVDVYRHGDDPKRNRPVKRHYILQDNLYIRRTDYFDEPGRLVKQRTQHDLKQVDGKMWRANMILMDNLEEQHRTLIKIDRRIFSRDYVPSEMFTREWLFNNQPSIDPGNDAENGEETVNARPRNKGVNDGGRS